MTMKQKIIIALLVAFTLTLATCQPAYAQRGPYPSAPPIGPSWQGSVEAAVELGVRDKLGALAARSYAATFTVTAPAGQQFFATVQVEGDGNGDVVFPRDFPGAERNGHIGRGRYVWACTVNGETVMRSTFIFASTTTFNSHSNRRPRRQR